MFIHQELLKNLGLSHDEILLYTLLMKEGDLSAGEIIKKSGLKRGHVYDTLHSLDKKELLEQYEKDKKSYFRAEHPRQLKNILEDKMESITDLSANLDAALPDLISTYILNAEKPGIFYFKGVQGLKKIYQDILHEKENLRIFASVWDKQAGELEKIIEANIREQKKLGIKTQALAGQEKLVDKNFLEKAREMGIDYRLLPLEKFSLKSQIIIYGTTVVITSLKEELITTLIENKNIADTLKQIFDVLWELAGPAHEEITKNL